VAGTRSGSYDACGGNWIITWAYTDPCGRTINHTQNITIQPAPVAQWVNPPANTSITCAEAANYTVPNLTYSNAGTGGCLIEGQTPAQVTANYSACGGQILAEWIFTDDCDRTITHTQTITVEPADPPVWESVLPADITITCAEAESYVVPDLTYANASSGSCYGEGSVPGIRSGSYDVCGGSWEIEWSYTDTCGRSITHHQQITIEPSDPPEWINPPGDTVISCAEAATFNVPNLPYTNNATGGCSVDGSAPGILTGTYDECGGAWELNWTYTDPCGRTINHTQHITIEPADAPQWVDPPIDITITCAEAESYTIPELAYTNTSAGSCLIAGNVPGTRTGSFDACGGSWTISWEYTDPCGRTINHTQNITIEPTDAPQWVNPPADITITCAEADAFTIPDLTFRNNSGGTCVIAGSVPGSLTGNYDACGGGWTIDWTYTDPCGRTIAHTQQITIEPSGIPQWINPPSDTSITCSEADTYSAPELAYSNSGSGVCTILGTVPASTSGAYDACGGVRINSWSYTDPCGRTITHTQTITIEPAELPQWIDPPADTTISCEAAELFSPSNLTFTNGESSSCRLEGTATPNVWRNYTACGGVIEVHWSQSDPCGRLLEHTQLITVEPSPAAQWIAPPADVTISCAEAATYTVPDLGYTNGLTNGCLISGTVSPIVQANYSACGGRILARWTFTDNCGRTIEHVQTITVEAADPPTWQSPLPIDKTISCTEAAAYVIPDLTYANTSSGSCYGTGTVPGILSGSYDACGGAWKIQWTYTDTCGRSIDHIQHITIEPAAAPQWVDPPGDMIITCAEADSYSVPELAYTNGQASNCNISGTVSGTRTGSYDQCGGAWTVNWVFTDDCGRRITHTQSITIEPAAAPQWVDPPADRTITCAEAASYSVPELAYSNGESGTCGISGTVPGTRTGSYDQCGGAWTITWEYADPCGTTLTHTQHITIEPAPVPQWVDPPADKTITCAEAATYSVPDLAYTNGDPTGCLISGTAPGVLLGSYDACGGSWIITWEATDACGQVISHTQQITIKPATLPQWIDPPADITITCEEAANYSVPDLSYSNGSSGTCLIDGSVAGMRTGSYDACGGNWTINWETTDDCGRIISHVQQITIEPAAATQWVDSPADTTISCREATSFTPRSLPFSNGENGTCSVEGVASPTVQSNYTACGGSIEVTWRQTDRCGRTIEHIQIITVVPADPPQWIQPPADTTITCAEAAVYVAPDLSFTNGGSGGCLDQGAVSPQVTADFDACGGQMVIQWQYTSTCGQTIEHTQTISVEPADPPAWSVPLPADRTISCAEAASYQIPDLAYANGSAGSCFTSGTVPGVRTGSYDVCGGNWTITWDYTDGCGRTIQHQQLITIEPAVAPQWVDPPADTTISCAEAATYTIPDLAYSNNAAGNCVIEGIVGGTRTGSFDQCGGSWIIEWEYTDPCGRNVQHTQLITIEPAAAPQWINPPGDMTITCAEAANYSVPDLFYSNGDSGGCQISGSVSGVRTGTFDVCGGNWTITWEYTGPCGVSLTHSQTIAIESAPPPRWIDPPAHTTIPCAEAATYTIPDLAYANGSSGLCQLSGSVSGIRTGSYDACGGSWSITWDYTDPCGRSISHSQTISIAPAPKPEWIAAPADTTLSCAAAQNYVIPDLGYSNGLHGGCAIEGSASPKITRNYDQCGGTITAEWMITDLCDRPLTHTQTITVEPVPPPAWDYLPADTVITCSEASSFSPPVLTYSNRAGDGCLIAGEAIPDVENQYTACGGHIFVRWSFTDPCGSEQTHLQRIEVQPPALPQFLNAPTERLDISCSEADTYAFPQLRVTNTEAGSCGIDQEISPTIDRSYSECGGTLTATWTYTDPCGRTVSHEQTLDVTPMPAPTWKELPTLPDEVSCSEAETLSFPDLSYQKGDPAGCFLEGTVAPVIATDFNTCGGFITVTWNHEDPCGTAITHQKSIAVRPSDSLRWVEVPPPTLVLSCDEAAAYEIPPLTYTNGISGTCSITGEVAGKRNGHYDACGGTWNIVWEYEDPCGKTLSYTQVISILPASDVYWIDPPDDLVISCDKASGYEVPPLAYSNGEQGDCKIIGWAGGTLSGTTNACGGSLMATWTYTSPCGQELTHQQEIRVLPKAPPEWINAPADTTISCAAATTYQLPTLTYSNGQSGACLVTGTIAGTQSGTYDLCGGTWENTWTYEDSCGQILQHNQTIQIEPAIAPTWMDLPADSIRITCAEAEGYIFPELAYSNARSGSCSINGTVSPVVSGTYNACGGQWEVTWQVTDPCGRTLQHQQVIIIETPAMAAWIDPPLPVDTVSCFEADQLIFPDLTYTNGMTESCAIAGTVSPHILRQYDQCGGFIEITWSTHDPCGRELAFRQKLIVLPPPAPEWINPPDTLITISCADRASWSFPDLTYSNGRSGACALAGRVSPTIDSTHFSCSGELRATWEVLTPCGNKYSYQQLVRVTPPEKARWVDTPVPQQTLSCDEAEQFSFDTLFYDNGSTGTCRIAGMAIPDVVATDLGCSRSLVATWLVTDECGRSLQFRQELLIEPEAPPSWIDPLPEDTTIACVSLSEFVFPELAYGNGSTGVCGVYGQVQPRVSQFMDACGGYLIAEWTFGDSCLTSLTHQQTVTILPPPAPVWVDPPADRSITCAEASSFQVPTLAFGNQQDGQCIIAGEVEGHLTGSFTTCGGTLTIDWIYTDPCGRTITHTQELEVLPASMPVWENPPSDTTITCEQAAAFRIPDLMYTNQQEGICNLTGTVAGQRSGSYNACGGFWDIYWSTTDSCGRTLEHTQRVTILPKSMPVWYRAPTDTTLSCGAAETFSPSPLLLSNGEHGPCAVQDTIEPTWQADYDACGGTILVQWNWSDSCGRTLRHQQQVIIQPQPDPVWIDPPEDTTISCFEAEDFRIDSLSYTGPANDSCLPAGRVAPVVVRDYDACGGQLRVHWSHVSPCGKETIHKQAINVLPAPDPVVLQMPEDTFMTCSEAARFRPDTLMYSNEAGVSCLLEGILVPQVTRNYDACGGQIVVSWTLESPCGLTRVIEQTVNVLPAPEPAWTHLPADTTLTYAAALSFRADPLTYANDSDQCQVTGTADPVVMGDFNVCGGILTIDWSASSICGHSLAHRQNITVLPAPAPGITLPEEHIIRCRGEAILLEPITEQVPPGGSWQWYYSPDSTVFSPLSQENEPSLRISNLTASDTGFYRLELSYSEDCSYVSGSVRLSVQGPASTFESYSICEGESISLRGEIVTQAGIYADTIVNPNGCDTIMIMEVRVIEAKETSEIRTICDGDTLRVAGQLYWEQGSYSSVYTGITGCDSIHTIHLEVLPLPRKTIQTSICAGSGYDFFGQSITKAGTYIQRLEQQQECDSLIRLELTIRPRIEELVQITFCEGDTLEFLGRTFTESTTFAVSYQTPGGCDSLVTYQIVREPIVFLEAYDTEICLGSSVSLELSTNSEHPIHWSPARGLSCTTCASPVATPETTTTYTVSTIGCGGQVITDSLTVFVNPTPSLPEMADTSINLGDILSIGLPPSNGAVQYDWFIADEWYCTACPSVELELNSSTTITVMAYTPFGCGDTASFRVEVIPRDCQEEQILVANAITPNNDGANDFLNIQNTGQARIRSVQIFTRWGEMIFQSDTPEERWDGTIMGAPANQGVYMYLITGTCANQKESFTLNGNVTLIR
jgi:gliding motility-associated-like protein